MTKMDNKLIMNLKTEIVKRIDVTKELADDEVYLIIDKCIGEYSAKHYIDMDNRLKARKYLFNSLRRLDVLQDLIEDENITEIMVNGPENIFVEKNGRLYKANLSFESEERLLDIIRRIASNVGRVVNESKPIVDARLEDGSRVNAVLPPVSLEGPVLTIRKFSKDIISLEKLIKLQSISDEAAHFLKILVRSGYNIFVSGRHRFRENNFA